MTVKWDEIRELIREDDSRKRDILITPKIIRWQVSNNALMVEANGSEQLYVSQWAEAQLCRWLGIPFKYFRECPGELKRMQVDFLIKKRLGYKKKWRLRLRGGTIRAFLSESFQPFDNRKVMSIWEEAGMSRRFDYEMMLDDTFFFLRAMIPVKVGISDGLGGLAKGVYIRNSEVGRSALAAGASVYRKICKNGLVEYIDRKPPLYQKHIWIEEVELAEKLKLALSGAIDIADWTLRRMARAREIPATLNELLERLDKLKLKELVRQCVVDSFISEGDKSVFGIVNAFSATARDLPPYDRYQLEVKAGRILAEVTRY